MASTTIDSDGNIVVNMGQGAPPQTYGIRNSNDAFCGFGVIQRTFAGVSHVFWLLLLIFTGACITALFFDGTFLFLVIVFAGWLMSLTLHEFGHAFTAYKGGDFTVVDAGYLSLDITRYADPLMTFVVPTALLAFGSLPLPGAAVSVKTENLRSSKWETYVALAGPAANLLCGVFLALLLQLITGIIPMDKLSPVLGPALSALAYFQIFACLLNLLPLPPLDGWHAVEPYLPSNFFLKRMMQNPYYNKSIVLVTFLILFLGITYIPGFTWAVSRVVRLLFLDEGWIYRGMAKLRGAFRLFF